MTCGKIRYESKSAAKRARRAIGDLTLRPYRCPICPADVFHLGHLPRRIIGGHTSRQEVYQQQD